MVKNIIYTSIISRRTHVIPFDDCLTGKKAYLLVKEKENLPSGTFNLSFNGRTIADSDDFFIHTKEDVVAVQMYIPVFAGKGGFGSMLRALGAQIEKTTNKEACRDLSGRRLRDVNAEKKFKDWVAKQAERKLQEEKKKKEKLEKMLKEPKIEFNDEEYFKTRSEIPDAVDDAVTQGLKKIRSSNATATVTSASATESPPPPPPSSSSSSNPKETIAVESATQQQPLKRKDPPEKGSKDSKKSKTSLWLGVDVDEDDLSDEDEIEETKTAKASS